MRQIILSIFLVSGTIQGALAQVGRPEAFGGVGWSKTWDDEGSIGTGLNVSGGVGIGLISRLGVELEVTSATNTRDATQGFHAKGRTTTVGPNLIYHFSSGKLKPFVLAGIHYFRHRGYAALVPDQTERTATGRAFRTGGGVKAFVSEKLFIRSGFIWISGGSGLSSGIELPVWSPRFSIGIGRQW